MNRNIITIAFIVLAVVLALGVNRINSQNPGYIAPDANGSATNPSSQAQPSGSANPSHPAGPSSDAQTPIGAKSDAPPDELTLGNPATAKTHVTIGYSIDETLQTNPKPLNDVITEAESWQKSHPTASVQVVDVDIPPSERTAPSSSSVPVGVTVSGASSSKLTGNPGEGSVNTAAIGALLSKVK